MVADENSSLYKSLLLTVRSVLAKLSHILVLEKLGIKICSHCFIRSETMAIIL